MGSSERILYLLKTEPELAAREIGRRSRQDILEEKRTSYGKEIVAALGRQLGWAHFKSLIPDEDSLKREFYAEMYRIEGWSTRILDKNIQSMLYERMTLSRKQKNCPSSSAGSTGSTTHTTRCATTLKPSTA